ESCDEGGVARGGRRVLAADGPGGADRAFDLDGILHAEGHAFERARIAGSDSLIGCGGLRERAFGENFDDGVDLWIDALDLVELRADQFRGRDAALTKELRHAGGRKSEDGVHWYLYYGQLLR